MARRVICLDTNYLIRVLVPGAKEAAEVSAWYRADEPLITPMLAWFEFLCGPVTVEQEEIVRGFLTEIVPMNEPQARLAADLFNQSGRMRCNRIDALIAATAIHAKARLATANRDDFAPFEAHGLSLI